MKIWCMDADSVTGYSEGQATPVERTGSSILPTRTNLPSSSEAEPALYKGQVVGSNPTSATNFRPSTRRHGSSETEVVSPAKETEQ